MEKLLHNADRFYPINLLYFAPFPSLRDCGFLRIFKFSKQT